MEGKNLSAQLTLDHMVLTVTSGTSFMTFGPEWLTGSPSLDISNPLYLWVYLVVSVIFIISADEHAC